MSKWYHSIDRVYFPISVIQ